MTAPAQPDIEIGLTAQEQTALDPPYRVIIYNDDVTPMDFVIRVLRTIFKLPGPDAEAVMWEAHTRGRAVVMVLPLEEAKHRVGRAHAVARLAGYPLAFTIEPE
jgi:ATP-dependent Clp protease adaptor protein ClpS